MKKLFSKSRIQVEEMLQDVTDFTKEMYKQKSAVYSPASAWGQIQVVLARHAQLMLYYIEDAVTESNIHTASRPQSIRGLARVAGYNPMRAIASTGEVFLSYGGSAPQINGENVIIPNYTKITCKDNQLDYLIVLGRDELKYNIYTERSRVFCRVIQGTLENQSFTGTGENLQSFEVNMSGGQKIDNFFINVFVNGEKWKKYDSLYDIPKNYTGCLVKTGITSGVDVYFGNGYFGKVPPLGSTIMVEYLITAGEVGNIRESEGVVFEFSSQGYDNQGNEVDLNTVFNIGISSPITFGSDSEPTFLTRLLAPLTSRSFVLANTTNYVAFFEKFQYFSYINCYTEYDEVNWFVDNIIYLILVPDITKRMRNGENYFTVPLEFFSLSTLEKFKIQRLLEESGQKIVNAIVRFVDPQFKRYATNIYIMVWEGTDKTTLKKDILDKLSEYLVNFKRKDFLPKSDLIAILEGITGIDSVNLYFVSEDIEKELMLLTDVNQINLSTILNGDEKNTLIDTFKTDTYLNYPDRRLALVLENQKVKDFIAQNIDENGDIVLGKNERPLLRGGWKDRNGNFYTDLIDKDKLSAVNINIIKENPRDINSQYNQINMNQLKK